MTNFYTYLWLREKDGTFPERTPYYAGKGSGKRAYKNQGHVVNRPKNRSYILLQYWPDEATAFAYERYLIDFYGRIDLGIGILRNLTDGGEGPSGFIPKEFSQERKQKLSEASKGNKNALGFKHSEETRQKLSQSLIGTKRHLGKKHSEETKLKISLAKKGKPSPRKGMKLSEETKLKISETLTGRKLSEETKLKLTGRKGRTGIPLSDEHKLKLSEAHKGKIPWIKDKKHTEESRKKMSESRKKFLSISN